MLNQFTIIGTVTEIHDNSFDLENDETIFQIWLNDEVELAKLLLNNQVAVKGHLEKSNNDLINLVCDNMTILDGRGVKR